MDNSEKLKQAEEIINMVFYMRSLQKQFFKGDRKVLQEAKEVEKRVDQRILEYQTGQTKLF